MKRWLLIFLISINLIVLVACTRDDSSSQSLDLENLEDTNTTISNASLDFIDKHKHFNIKNISFKESSPALNKLLSHNLTVDLEIVFDLEKSKMENKHLKNHLSMLTIDLMNYISENYSDAYSKLQLFHIVYKDNLNNILTEDSIEIID